MKTTAPLSRSSQEILARAREVMPGGAPATYRMPGEVAVAMSHAEGSRIYDVEGKEYIDYNMGSGPMLVGHRHPEVVAAVEDQLRRGTQFYTLSEEVVAFCEALVAGSPCADAVKLTSSGAEATFYALRVARAATGREKLLKFSGAYHGHHDYAMAGSSIKTAGIPDTLNELVVTGTYNDEEAARELISRHASDLAAVIVEPVQRNTVPRPGFLQALRDVTSEHGIVLIFDEMVTGFRIAFGGGQERYGVIPDMATYGKAIGGGMPVAAIAGRDALMEHLNPEHTGEDDYVYCSGTLNGNPLGAAGGLATLNVLSRDGVYEHLEDLGEHLRTGLREAAGSVGYPVQVVGVGALVGVLFAEGDPLDPATASRSDAARRARVQVELIKRGIFVNLPAKFYLSTEHDWAQVERSVDAFREALLAAS